MEPLPCGSGVALLVECTVYAVLDVAGAVEAGTDVRGTVEEGADVGGPVKGAGVGRMDEEGIEVGAGIGVVLFAGIA